jgi:hypothetical protein
LKWDLVTGITRCLISLIASSKGSAQIQSALLSLALLALALPAVAYETDQFSNRMQSLDDSTEVLNQRVNQTIEEIVVEWKGPRDDRKFVNRIFHRIGGYHWVDRLERWAMKSQLVDRLEIPRRRSIYAGHPFWATRFAGIFGVGPTIKLNQVFIGSDKIGHFLSQGRKYYRRYLRLGNEAEAGAWSAYTERAIFGQLTTGSYSNADLVANYEGYLFYRSLFENGVIPGKPSILLWNGRGWEIQRSFDWADHVNDYWDEALNINHFDRLLHDRMQQRLLGYCDDYRARPALYEMRNEAELARKYAHIGLRDTSDLRLSYLCTQPGHSDGTGAINTER